MSALPITITTAGLQALVNAQNTGVSNVVIAALGVCPNQVAITAATTVIPGELKRLGGVAGMVTAEDTIYVSAADQTQDTYNVRTIALYLGDGTLFAGYSQAAPLVEKAGPSQAVLEASIKLAAPMAEVVQFEGGGWVNPPASEAVAGVLRLATLDEAIAGVSHSKSVTPKGLKAVTAAMMAAIQATLDQIGLALAGKANVGHQHDATNVVSGTFSEARIPELPMARIGGLIATLADKASALHSHTQAQVGGLVQALADIWTAINTKADSLNTVLTGTARISSFLLGTGRTYVYSEAESLNVRTGPTGGEHWLAFTSGGELYLDGMRVWDARNFDPATKAQRHSPGISGTAYLGQDKAGQVWVVGGDDRAGVVEWRVNGVRVGFMGYGDGPNGNPYIGADGDKVWIFNKRPSFNGATPWDTNNLNAADLVKISTTNLGRTGSAPVANFTSAAQIGDLPTGYSAIFPGGTFGMPPLPGYYFKVGRRDHSGGWGGVVVGHAEVEGQAVDAWVGAALAGTSMATWTKLWTAKNFNPATKVDVYNTDGYPHAISLGWSGSRMVARVDNAAATPGHALVHLADAASSAEAVAGVATDRFMTPAALWSFARSYGASGYQRIPGSNLIIQWGVHNVTVPEGEVHTALPVAFGGGCLFAAATPRNAAGVLTMDFYMQVMGRWLDRISWYANRANGGAGNMSGFEWMAIGLAVGNPDPVYYSGGGGDPGGGDPGGGGGPIIQV
ncbi:hypothetical protein ACFPIF_10035 [Brevundimonas faecalis]|uniref:gp53-like domain-containing protein n=1 Tax=Brevundimonas faecalis TaxID=947378 RepID=UPI003607D135